MFAFIEIREIMILLCAKNVAVVAIVWYRQKEFQFRTGVLSLIESKFYVYNGNPFISPLTSCSPGSILCRWAMVDVKRNEEPQV